MFIWLRRGQLALALIVLIATAESWPALQGKGANMFQLKSPAFQAGTSIPQQFTCEGNDVSPEIAWQNAPSGAKTFALVVHDPDARRAGGFTHWVIYNIPSTTNRIAQGVPKEKDLPGGGVQGRNDFGKAGYGGPCPPSGTHRYYFRLYALDSELKLNPSAGKEELEKAMKGHVLGQAELMGTYKKGNERAA